MVKERQLQEIAVLIVSFSRAIRVLEHILQYSIDKDIVQKVTLFLESHQKCKERLAKLCPPQTKLNNTPQEIILFPETGGELLNLAARTEKILLEQHIIVLEMDLDEELSDPVKDCKEIVAKSYDYIEALSDLWV